MNGRGFGTMVSGVVLVSGAITGQVAAAASGSFPMILHSFSGGDGRLPAAGLLIDTFGSFYGTTEFGAAAGGGAVFVLTPLASPGGGWTATMLHQFAGHADGFKPTGNLVFDSSGALYGTTLAGGAANA